ncbi:MAG: TonB-dependent receptor [Symploca sp. SIO2G7]|nr:TonB-dependent receptor [Symploca sp. SIO2G7]
MNWMYWQNCLLITGATWFVVISPVCAEVSKQDVESSLVSDRASSELTQSQLTNGVEEKSFSPVPIVDILLNPTTEGIEIILETSESETLSGSTSTAGNNLIIDIPNAQLQLSPGEEFRQDNPTPGIRAIAVTNATSNSVRLTITGSTGVPLVRVASSDRGLVVSLTQKSEAETVQPDIEEEIIEIIVTAEKTEEDVQDVPISITAIPEQEIEDANINSLSDIANNTPNFSVFSGAGESRSFINYSMRGLGNVNFFTSDAVGFYVDDVPIDTSNATAFLNVDLVELERVEILRGPQGTLYGRNAQAGVVNIVTRKPTNIFEFSGNASYGNFDAFNIGVSVSGPIEQNRLFFRLTGNYLSRDGFLENTFLDDDVDDQSGGGSRGQLLWTPSEDWEISFNVAFDDYRDGDVPFVLLNQSDPLETERDFNGFNNLNSNTQSLKIAYNNPNFSVTSITARRYFHQEYDNEGDLTLADSFRAIQEFESTVWTQELRLQSPNDANQFQWLLGGYFESRDLDNTDDGLRIGIDALSAFGIPPGTDVANSEVNTNIYAVFGQISYQPINPLTLTAGLRYESTNTTLESLERTFTLVDGPALTTFSASDVEQNSSPLLPRFVVEYRINPDLMAYGSVARGFKPGGVNYRATDDVTLTFDAEKSWNYEVGLKSVWLDNRLTVNLAVFHNPVEDYQVVFFENITGLPQRVANADVSITGAELEVRATPIDGLDLIAGLGFIDAEFTEFNDPVTGTNFNENQVNYAPEFSYNLAIQYRALNGLLARLELQGLGKTFFDEANTLQQDPYLTINARLGYEANNFGIYFFANNIFDTEYLSFAAPLIAGETLALYGTPATYGVQLKLRF